MNTAILNRRTVKNAASGGLCAAESCVRSIAENSGGARKFSGAALRVLRERFAMRPQMRRGSPRHFAAGCLFLFGKKERFKNVCEILKNENVQ